MAPVGLGELLAFVGLPSNRSARELSGKAEDLFKGITGLLDDLLKNAIDKRTGPDFTAARGEDFAKYFSIVRALSSLVHVIVPKPVIEQLIGESFSELEAELREQGLARFGTAARDQAVFTVWTLRKISRLISKIAKSDPLSEEAKATDREFGNEFSFYAIWAQFHLDCLVASIRYDRMIRPEVLMEICDGLRAAVNAYGLIRQAVELRTTNAEEPSAAPYVWDDEDQILLDSSMREMETLVLEDDSAWSENEAKAISCKKPIEIEIERKSAEPTPAFGTHIREGIEIVKDWIQNPKPKE